MKIETGSNAAAWIPAGMIIVGIGNNIWSGVVSIIAGNLDVFTIEET